DQFLHFVGVNQRNAAPWLGRLVANDAGKLGYRHRRDDFQRFGAGTHNATHIRNTGFGNTFGGTDNQRQRHGEHFLAAFDFTFHRRLMVLDIHALGGRYGRDAQQLAKVGSHLGTIVVDRLPTGEDKVKRMVFGIIGDLEGYEPRVAGYRIYAHRFVGADGQGLADSGFGSSFADID